MTTLERLTLPPGTEVFLPILLLHLDQNVWIDDAKEIIFLLSYAKEFNPGRFAVVQGKTKTMRKPIFHHYREREYALL